MRIMVENSTWNNIGDAFYQIPLSVMLSEVFEGHASVFPLDGPVDRAFKTPRRNSSPHDSRFPQPGDHFVFSGPILERHFYTRYAPLIQSILACGGSYSLLSVHTYLRDQELDELKTFFRRFPPTAISSRDRLTYDLLQGSSALEYDGYCFAYFLSKTVPVAPSTEDYICVSYYSHLEPKIDIEKSADKDAPLFKRIRVGDTPKSFIPWKFLRHFEQFFSHRSELEGLKVVRPVHGHYPFSHLTFSKPNSYASYNPNCFIGVYANSRAVISDRVHAGVAGLSFNKPVFVERLDDRFEIFERLDLDIHDNGFMTLAHDRLEDAYSETKNWLHSKFKEAVLDPDFVGR